MEEPVFTPREIVRQRILLVLIQAKSGHLSAATALDRVRKQFPWTKADVYPWSGEYQDMRWGERISRERDHMVNDGLLRPTDAMTWMLTREGADTARELARELDKQEWKEREASTALAREKRQAALKLAREQRAASWAASRTHKPAEPEPPREVVTTADLPEAAQAARPDLAPDALFREPPAQKIALPLLPEAKEAAVVQEVVPAAAPRAFPVVLNRDQEFDRREQLWAALQANGGPSDVPRGLLRELKIYGNQAGIYVPSAETRTRDTPKGIALSFLHTGRHYDDELTETGVIYHYPTTGRSGHDESEIEASKAAYRAALPVFVIGPGSKATTRTVHRGYIEDVDDSNRVLLITFTRAELPPPPTKDEQTDPFSLTDSGPAPTFTPRRNRPNQVRFAFDVFKRYGAVCAACGLNVKGLVQAAHLLSKKLGGSDDARNGLPLCANHHLAFDRGYWCVDTDLKLHAQSDGPALFDLAISRSDLSHLPHAPHHEALTKIWTDWKSKQSGPG